MAVRSPPSSYIHKKIKKFQKVTKTVWCERLLALGFVVGVQETEREMKTMVTPLTKPSLFSRLNSHYVPPFPLIFISRPSSFPIHSFSSSSFSTRPLAMAASSQSTSPVPIPFLFSFRHAPIQFSCSNFSQPEV